MSLGDSRDIHQLLAVYTPTAVEHPLSQLISKFGWCCQILCVKPQITSTSDIWVVISHFLLLGCLLTAGASLGIATETRGGGGRVIELDGTRGGWASSVLPVYPKANKWDFFLALELQSIPSKDRRFSPALEPAFWGIPEISPELLIFHLKYICIQTYYIHIIYIQTIQD